MNVVIVSGRLSKDGVFKEVNGAYIYNNTIAIQREYKENGEYKVDFVDIAAFGGSAKFMNEYLHKGDTVVIQGNLSTNSYVDKGGTERKAYCIKVHKVNLLAKKKEDCEQVSFEEIEKDLPF